MDVYWENRWNKYKIIFETWKGNRFYIYGRNEKSEIPIHLYEVLDKKYSNIKEKVALLFPERTVCFYGEGYGPKIQNGEKYRINNDFILFDIKVDDLFLKRTDVEDIGNKLGLDVVPIIGEGTIHDAVEMTERGIISTFGNFKAEGIVIRPKIEINDRRGNRIIAKIKGNDFI